MSKKYTIEDLHAFAKTKGGKCLSTTYINSHTKYLWEDAEGNQWEAKWYAVNSANTWSPYTAQQRKADKLQKYTIEDLIKFAKDKGGKCLSTVYINDKTKYEWEDSQGRYFKKTWTSIILAGQWSPHEKKETLSKLKSKYTIQYLIDFAIEKGGKCLSTEFIRSSSLYLWEDSHGNKFSRSWYNVKRSEELNKYHKVSAGHKEIIDYLKKIGVDNMKINDRTVIKPNEIDIYCPEYGIGIEFNGLMYHNMSKKEIYVDYHKDKQIKGQLAGIDIIQIYDLEWNKRKNQVKSFLRAKFSKCKNKIYGRKTEIREVPFKEGNLFLDTYHIIGKVSSGKFYGLYHQNELVAVITIGNHPNRKSDSSYLTRFCVKDNYYVIGGLMKLSSHARSIYGSIETWIDLRYSSGDNWIKSGWDLVHRTKPTISYYDQNRKILYRNRNGDKSLVCVYDCGKLKLSF